MMTQKYEWLEKEPEIDEKNISRVINTELLICGGGTGGLFAAAVAAEAGIDTLVIEKRPVFSKVKDEFAGVGSRLQKEYGVEIDKWELLHEAAMYSSNSIDQKLWML